MDFVAEVTIEVDKYPIINETLIKPSSQFWRNDDGGIVFIRYRVPDIVPRNEPVYIKVSTSGNIENFLDNYGETNIVVKKISDE